MELDHIVKKIDWLEEQRRKDRDQIAALEERVLALQGQMNNAETEIKEQAGDIAHQSAILKRVEQFESQLNQYRMEFSRAIEEIEKARAEREREIDEVRRVQIDGVNSHLIELRKGLDPIPDLQEKMRARVMEETRLSRMIEEVRNEFRESRSTDEEWTRSLKLLEESLRRDSKRLTDVQGETLALRKRVDEHRGRIDLADDSLRKLSTRVTELVTMEGERRDNLSQFLEKQSLVQVDRDRRWKEWQTRFETIENQGMELESQLQALHVASRDVKRTQETVEALSERIERRINEITEIQRLGEDRFRQEWVTFKADDQKRWTNFTLTQDENARELLRTQTRLQEQTTQLGDRLQEVQDIVQQMESYSEKQLQTLLSIARDWVTEYERLFGRSRSA